MLDILNKIYTAIDRQINDLTNGPFQNLDVIEDENVIEFHYDGKDYALELKEI